MEEEDPAVTDQQILHKKTFGFCSVFLLLMICLDTLFSDIIFTTSFRMAQAIASELPQLKTYENFWTNTIRQFIVLYLFYFILNKDKVYLLRTCVFVGLVTYLTTGLKNLYGDLRPRYFEGSRISELANYAEIRECSIYRGKPSGHMSEFSYIILNVMIQMTDNFNVSKSYIRGLLIAFLFIVGNIAISRFYTMGHSINQIYYGLAIGLWVASQESYTKLKFEKFVHAIIDKNPFKLEKLKYKFRTFTILFMVLVLIPILMKWWIENDLHAKNCFEKNPELKSNMGQSLFHDGLFLSDKKYRQMTLEISGYWLFLMLYLLDVNYEYNDSYYKELGIIGQTLNVLLTIPTLIPLGLVKKFMNTEIVILDILLDNLSVILGAYYFIKIKQVLLMKLGFLVKGEFIPKNIVPNTRRYESVTKMDNNNSFDEDTKPDISVNRNEENELGMVSSRSFNI